MKGKILMALLFINCTLSISSFAQLASQTSTIYGITLSFKPYITGHTYFYRYDYLTGKFDTLINLDSTVVFEKAVCTDEVHHKYIFCGGMSGRSGNYHIIDLRTFFIEDFTSKTSYELEYNPINNSIMFLEDSNLYSINLSTKKLDSFYVPFSDNYAWEGKTMVFYPKDTLLYFQNSYDLQSDIKYSYYAVNPITEEIKCFINPINKFCGSWVIDFSTGNIYCHFMGRVYQIDPCTGNYYQKLIIPGFYSYMDLQMSVYDQNLHKYIVPFFYKTTGNGAYSAAIIDMKNFTIDTIVNETNESINYQQIVQTTVGEPEKISENAFKIYPNPVNAFIQFEIENNVKPFKFQLFDLYGRVMISQDLFENDKISVNHLKSGIYFYMVILDNKVQSGKLIIE